MKRIYLASDGTVRTPVNKEFTHYRMAQDFLGKGWSGDPGAAYAAMGQAGWVRVVDTPGKLYGEKFLNGKLVPFSKLTAEQRGWFAGKRSAKGKLFIWNDHEFGSRRKVPPGDRMAQFNGSSFPLTNDELKDFTMYLDRKNKGKPLMDADEFFGYVHKPEVTPAKRAGRGRRKGGAE